MIRLYCVDGPLAGQCFTRPDWLTDEPMPPLIVMETRGGLYLASPPPLAGWPSWEAVWLPVGEREAVAA